MENRRPNSDNASRPFNRTDNFRKSGDRPTGARGFQPRDDQSQPRNDRSQTRDARNQTSDSRSQGNDTRNQSRDNRFQSRDNYQARDNNQTRDDNRRGDARFLPRSDKSPPRGRFAPRGKNVKPWEQEEQIRIVSDMQITDGKHRGKYLKSTTSERVRPTARRIREMMFRILLRRVRAGRFLDLCAGAGTIGIEAISRGALLGTFVERSAQMCGHIKKNLASCGIKEGHGEVHEIEVVPFLKRMEKRRRFWDVIYFDPPYDSNYEEVLAFFGRGATLKPRGVLVIEHHAEMFFPEIFGVMKRWRVVVQGDTALSFYEKN